MKSPKRKSPHDKKIVGTIPVRCSHDRIVQLAGLKPHPRNPNKHPAAQISLLAKILTAQGWRLPIVVSKRSGLIVAGHARLQAAVQLGLEAGPVNFQDFDSDEQELAHLVADNKIAELAETDDATLKSLIKELGDTDLDLDLLGLGDDLQRLLSEITPPEADDEHAVELIDKAAELQKKWKVKLGDVWQLEKNRIVCGDNTDPTTLNELFGKEKADLIFTSPPYNQNIANFSKSGMHKETKWVDNTRTGSYFDNRPELEYQEWQIKSVKAWLPYLTETASVFYNHKNRFRDKQCISPWIWIEKTGGKVRQEIIWQREGSVTQNARMFMPCDERIYWLYFGNQFVFNDTTEIKTWSTVWKINSQKDKEASTHGCAFPVELPTRGILACSKTGQIVFEPYSGSGTTVIAAEQTGRLGFATELDPKFVAVALQRWSDLTGKTPKLLK
jgi:DNA modification methylase